MNGLRALKTLFIIGSLLVFSGCGTTVIGRYERRMVKQWWQISEYYKIPVAYISGGGGKLDLEDKEGKLKGERTKGSLINLGSIVDKTNAEVGK